MRLVELRQLIEWEMLTEGANIGALAARGLTSRGIVIDPNNGGEIIVVVSKDKRVTYRLAHNSELPLIFGAAEGELVEPGVWRLRTLYADDPVSAVMAMTAALNRWKRVVPDHSVSPAAKAVIRRYYDANKDDPMKVDDNFDVERNALPYLKAAYLGPVAGFSLKTAIAQGDVAVDAAINPENQPVKNADRVRGWLAQCAQHGFQDAFQDDSKTKRRPRPDPSGVGDI